jgi:hypothetical protein
MTEANPASTPEAAPQPRRPLLTRPQLMRVLLTAGMVLCFLVFWWSGKLLGIPADDTASLLQASGSSLGVVLILLVGCTALASTIAGTARPDAGLFCAAFGLAALSLRDGSIRTTLQSASSPGILAMLAVELCLLYVGIGACWAMVRFSQARGLLKSDIERDGLEDQEESTLVQKLSASAAQAGIMLVLMWLLAQYDAKVQVLAAVAISAWLGTVLSHYFLHPARPSAWFLAGPLVVGLVGYLATYASAAGDAGNPAGWRTANLQGAFAAMARPLPLDYASVGVAGTILGYWMSRRWRTQQGS